MRHRHDLDPPTDHACKRRRGLGEQRDPVGCAGHACERLVVHGAQAGIVGLEERVGALGDRVHGNGLPAQEVGVVEDVGVAGVQAGQLALGALQRAVDVRAADIDLARACECDDDG